ncbi:MAG: YbjQ family protein [Acidimicrobiales bacterium]
MLNFTITTAEPFGFQIAEIKGDVSGVSVRTWHIFSALCIMVRAIIGGEVKSRTKRLVKARAQAMARMTQEAERLGANAVVGLNVQVSGISVYATGTAVRVRD